MTNYLKIFQWAIHLFVIYSYFLIYAQFGFLRYLQAFEDPQIIKQIMPMMLIGAFCSGMLIRFKEIVKIKSYLLGGFLIAIAVAASPIFFQDLKLFYIESFFIGLSIGTLTILSTTTLYNHLRYFEVILVASLSTASAYFFCNIPWLHYNSPTVISSVASILAVIGLINCSLISWDDKRLPRQNIRLQSDRQFYLVVLMFFVVLFIDSYSFYVIQNNELLMKFSWGDGYCFNQGLYHVLGAFLAYHFLSQKQIHYLLCVVMFLFCISIHRIGGEGSFIFAYFYAIGIAMYSTALISYPANFSDSFEKRKKITTDLYLIAGWLGSGLGVVFADGKTSISFEFFTVLLVIYTIILSLAALSNSRVRIAAFLVMTLLLQRLHSSETVKLSFHIYTPPQLYVSKNSD
ncbi:MAG: hypothetical protein KC646_13285 [Candidatus Cloacimonetes bacterium]|nr:hypothetical protein [Candidatus Cloacimonadota bacterium]